MSFRILLFLLAVLATGPAQAATAARPRIRPILASKQLRAPSAPQRAPELRQPGLLQFTASQRSPSRRPLLAPAAYQAPKLAALAGTQDPAPFWSHPCGLPSQWPVRPPPARPV